MFREAIQRALGAESLALLESMAVAKEEGERERKKLMKDGKLSDLGHRLQSNSLAFPPLCVWRREKTGRGRKTNREGGKERVEGERAVRTVLLPRQRGQDSCKQCLSNHGAEGTAPAAPSTFSDWR